MFGPGFLGHWCAARRLPATTPLQGDNHAPDHYRCGHRGRPDGHPGIHGLRHNPADDPNDVTQVDNPADENDSGGFDDWGLLGLLGLAGLAGLKRRNEHVTTVRDDNLASR